MRADGEMYEPRVKSKPDRSFNRGGKEGQSNHPTGARTLSTQVVRVLQVFTGPTRSSLVEIKKEV